MRHHRRDRGFMRHRCHHEPCRRDQGHLRQRHARGHRRDQGASSKPTTGHRLTITVVETGEIRRRVLAGENFDVIIVPRTAADEFEKAGQGRAGQRGALIRVNFGLAVPTRRPAARRQHAGALKRTLLAAKTVLITDPATGGISGVHFMEVLDKLGIAEEMKRQARAAARAAASTPAASSRARPISRCRPSTRSAASRARPSCPTRRMFQRTIVFIGGIGSAAGTPRRQGLSRLPDRRRTPPTPIRRIA